MLSKLLPLALLLLSLSLILLLVGLIGRWCWPVITAVVLLWVCSLGLVSQTPWRWLEAPWTRKPASTAPAVDAIVVHSGGRHPATGVARVSHWHDPDRFLAGLDLYRAGKAPRLLRLAPAIALPSSAGAASPPQRAHILLVTSVLHTPRPEVV